ncbi:E3 SUMO-protein ligase PIAS3-like [Rhopalosiphum padi]|uniref:E3 SUMO-protein ligase PIAS3-like n=1 Tax=Rhopalosiphum padi TaxID=40932 RepID=UPI00298D7662|nr:E3 SUMO-protein ligase PIAS3-like [Rhopalosiphum padi]
MKFRGIPRWASRHTSWATLVYGVASSLPMGHRQVVDDALHHIVRTFSSEDIRRILCVLPNQVIHGDKTSLCNRLIYFLTSSASPSQKSLAKKEIIKVYKARSRLIKQRRLFNKPIPTSLIPTPAIIRPTTSITFEHDLPFFKILKTVLAPLYCSSTSAKLFSIYFIEKHIKDFIVQSWDNQSKKYKHKIILRLDQLERKSFIERLPNNIDVSLNGRQCKLPELNMGELEVEDELKMAAIPVLNSPTSTDDDSIIPFPWRHNIPIEFTEYLNLQTGINDVLCVSWSDEPISYIVGIFVVQKLTSEDLLVELKKRPIRAYEKTIKFIKELNKSDVDFRVNTHSVTIKDPLTMQRMKLPARGVECVHLQCFDAISFLQMNEQKQTWLCPLCKKQVKFENLEIDEYFFKIVQSPTVSEECENVILLKDGTWVETKTNAFSSNSKRKN